VSNQRSQAQETFCPVPSRPLHPPLLHLYRRLCWLVSRSVCHHVAMGAFSQTYDIMGTFTSTCAFSRKIFFYRVRHVMELILKVVGQAITFLLSGPRQNGDMGTWWHGDIREDRDREPNQDQGLEDHGPGMEAAGRLD
jgi:hypothetical protein